MGKRTRELRREMELDEQLDASAMYDSDPEEKELSVEATEIFFRNQKAKAQLLVNRGGAGSSKSFSLAQLMLFKFFTEDRKKILILRKSLPSLRISVLPLMNEIASAYGLKDRILEEKVHLNWYYNGGLIHFGSLDDPEKIKCFHPDTDLLTFEGWKNVADVKVGDLVATMDPVTRKVCYKPATKAFAYDYKGDMFTGEGFCVTGEHKFLLSDYSFVPINNLTKESFVVKDLGEAKQLGDFERSFYEGKVYCVEVPPYHTLITKFSQVIVITGNSSEWNYVWLEEATEFTFEDFKTVKLRLRAKSRDGLRNQMYLSFNPIDEFHWIKEKVVDGKGQDSKDVYDFEEIVSTYRDNPYLTSDYIEDLERLQQQDISFYNIYSLGNWGKLENLVYSNWDIVNWMPDEGAVDTIVYGLDFGYNDPTALIKCYIRKTEVWEEEKLYHTGLTNSDLILKLQSIIPIEDRRRHIIYADSQEPDRIKEIKDAGFLIKPANKLILPGIDTVKRTSCHIYAGSDNLIKEKRAYSWKKDRAGNLVDEPVDFLNHLIDAERYALHTNKRRGVGIRVRYI